jgi:hypothetical protein
VALREYTVNIVANVGGRLTCEFVIEKVPELLAADLALAIEKVPKTKGLRSSWILKTIDEDTLALLEALVDRDLESL